MRDMGAIYLLLAVLLVAFGVWVVVQSIRRKGKMGINVKSLVTPTFCPNCGQRLPRVRIPRNLEQFLWGGWTCPNCGTDIDKWGNKKA